ncbi:1-acyl-sn-glycerol-3-phosphate acyltransferase [Natranaerovirga pectinivora]|uniref:1-acyl-sn-glycerol-3-phosphate acyltransferase n=1 Tax=Natranaerovirga pectinivora TaxID=682400 RepID=A0A4R3MPS3_9FIRM|nr:lysophospholipid acyltransferase family protein [Natranaerovirga pectinivora]TCT16281.1 1-acyl-sn-glycerol-3-phosphate acyltransferase [Natranaerovirga pectinivora]
MIKTSLWFVNFVLYQILSLFFLFKYKVLIKIGKEERAKKYLHKVTTRWARNMVKSTGSKINVIGLDNVPKDENVLFVSNHQGNFDIPLLLGYLPTAVGFVAKVELQKVPVVRTWMALMKCVFIDRKDPRHSLQAIITGINYLKEGHSMVIFPEGTRSKRDEVGEFKAGSMKMALKSNVKIVPITIDGSYKMLEEHNKIKKVNVNLIIHPPIDINALEKEEAKNLHEYIRNIIINK